MALFMALSRARVVLTLLVAVVTPCANTCLSAATPAAAATSKTYLNAEFGFGFDYPASWSPLEKQSMQSEGVLLSLKFLSRDENVPVMRDYSPGSFAVDVYENPTRKTTRAWLDEHGWPFGVADRSVTATSVGGLPALEVATGRMFAPNRFVYVAAADRVLRLSPLAPESAAVLKSFRFNP